MSTVRATHSAETTAYGCPAQPKIEHHRNKVQGMVPKVFGSRIIPIPLADLDCCALAQCLEAQQCWTTKVRWSVVSTMSHTSGTNMFTIRGFSQHRDVIQESTSQVFIDEIAHNQEVRLRVVTSIWTIESSQHGYACRASIAAPLFAGTVALGVLKRFQGQP